jgi:hypothetical protein
MTWLQMWAWHEASSLLPIGGGIMCHQAVVPMTESACPKENLKISIFGISERGAVRE